MISVINLNSGKIGVVLGETVYADSRLKRGSRAVYIVRPEGASGKSYWNKDACIENNTVLPRAGSTIGLLPV